MNASDIPSTPENIMLGIGIIFGIGFVCLIGWAIYQALGK